MDSTPKKSPAVRGIPQPFNRPTGPTLQTRPVVAQLKTGVSAQSVKQPVAPPVYRPQPVPKVLQRKIANVAANGTPPVAFPVRRSQPPPPLLTSAISPFRGVVQQANKKKKGAEKKELSLADHYHHAELIIVGYNMDKQLLRWLKVGQRIGYDPPNLYGFHAGDPSKAGSKAEKQRLKQITPILADWKAALKQDLEITHGIEESALGKIEDALTAKGM